MAPISKEIEVPVATNNPSAPGAPQAKSPTDASARPQPVALEIPVTVNGARTIEGSDKREPFSETSHTVLVFPLGTVVRLATPLVPGQLVFLTNEKTKKEIVCQVVKSKSGGNTSGYVELQFTEPAASFWGMLLPGTSAAPSAPRPVAPPPSPTISQSVAVPNSVPVHAVSAPLGAPAPPAPEVPKVHPIPEPPPVSSQTTTHVNPPSVVAQAPVFPAPALRNYSKEIGAMFAVPQAPLTPPAAPVKPEPNPVPPASSAPSTDELKLQAARLQVQLSSLLFTETKNTAPAPPPSFTPPATPPPALPVADAVKKVLQTTLEEAKPLVKSEPKLVPFPERKPASLPPADTGEVRVPSWLAPVSRNAEPAEAEPAASSGIASEPASSAQLSSEESQEQHSDAALFDGQPLSDTSAPAEEVAETGSKKSLFLGLAAAILLFLGGGAWHFRQNLFGTAATPPVAPAKTSSSVVSAPPLSDSPATAGVSTPTTTSGNAASPASPPVVSQASKSSSPLPTKAVFTPVPDPKVSESAPRSVARVEPPKKPAVGGIKLAKPVINRGSVSQQAGEALPALDMSSAMTDSLAAVNVGRGKEPVAPLPVGGDVKPARLIKSVPPVYPTIAKTQRVSGDVQLDALIDVTGNVASVKVISGPTLLHRAALDAVKQWKYTPALLNDQPTAMHLTVTVQFRTQ